MSAAVLIVDDSLTVRMNLVELMEGAGLTAVACANAAKARQALSGDRFALVILDVLLPDGNGVELLARLQHFHLSSASVACARH